MKQVYDREVDALYIQLTSTSRREGIVERTEELSPWIMVDYDAGGRIVGIEVLRASEHLSADAHLEQLQSA